MCQTAVISNNIGHLRTLVPDAGDVAQLKRLNSDLQDFYELLYSQWNTVTEEEYAVFGHHLVTMLQAIKNLYLSCKRAVKSRAMEKQVEILGMNYSALYEINSDIINFCIESKKDQNLQKSIHEASNSLNNDNF